MEEQAFSLFIKKVALFQFLAVIDAHVSGSGGFSIGGFIGGSGIGSGGITDGLSLFMELISMSHMSSSQGGGIIGMD